MLLAGAIDATAIDTTVLEAELQRHPALQEDIRVVTTLGPSPIPPWVVLQRLPPEMRSAVREVLLHMHQDPHGRTLLMAARVARFVHVDARDYDPIRQMARQAAHVTL